MPSRNPLESCLVAPGEQSPYADLTVDLAFKKAFDPDKEISRENLVNLLNDILGPQLKHPVRTVRTRNVAQNLSGSAESRTAIFDLHCEDDRGNLIEIEVQIKRATRFLQRLAFYAAEMVANQSETGLQWKYNVKPTYVIAIMRENVFDDDRAVHRATTLDLETGKQFLETFNFTVLELKKVPFFIEKTSDSVAKWLFFFRYLNSLKRLPEELGEGKFVKLTESSKVSNFTKREFEAYQTMRHEDWDRGVIAEAFIEDNPDVVKEIRDEGAADAKREMAKAMLTLGDSVEKVAQVSGLSEEEIRAL